MKAGMGYRPADGGAVRGGDFVVQDAQTYLGRVTKVRVTVQAKEVPASVCWDSCLGRNRTWSKNIVPGYMKVLFCTGPPVVQTVLCDL